MTKPKEDNNATDELWTIGDIAEYLKISKGTMYRRWKDLGVRPVVAYRGAKPRFLKTAIIKAVTAMK